MTAPMLALPSRRAALNAESGLALAVVLVVALLIVPLPSAVLDALLVLNIALSLLVLLVTLTTQDPLEFSVFPTLLLPLTLFRLGLNVGTTRLILSRGEAGHVIEAFGHAVIGGNYVVGLVIFLILIVINFVVITKGSGRIAEVAARFTLDAMPGRQMAIDADLGAGLIDEKEARRRRDELTRYSDFFGAMDGAAKFVRGDAMAALLITGINLVGGFIVGIAQQGLDAGEAARLYTTLSIGDGLVSQVPALIVSTAAGIIVTYSSKGPSIGPAMVSQLTKSPTAVFMASGILFALGLVPGFPFLPFALLGVATAGVAFLVQDRDTKAAVKAATPAPAPAQAARPADPQAQLRELLAVEPLELEVGYALVPLVDEKQGGDLLQRIGLMRKQMAVELGIVIPPARIRDNIQLPATEYAIKLRGVKVAGGEVLPKYLLALDTGTTLSKLEGVPTRDPSFGMPAVWITPDRRMDAEANGWSVVEPQTVLATHLSETIRRHAADLLGRQEVRQLLDGLKESHPALVDDIQAKVPLGTVHRVLQRLLKEGVPVRDLASILEALCDAAETSKDPEVLAEHARRSLSSVIAQLHDEGDGTVHGITLGPRLEVALMQLFAPRPTPGQRSMDPDELAGVLRELNQLAERNKRDGQYRPLITPPSLRIGVRRLLEPVLPHLPVLSMGELPSQTPVHSHATWELARAA